MPALNFQSRFAPLVKSGAKRQTIRARRKDGRDPKPGDVLHLYTGMRTKKCRMLGEARCQSARPVTIERVDSDGGFAVSVNGVTLTWRSAFHFSRRDGFRNSFEMLDWFERVHGLPFEGLVIRW